MSVKMHERQSVGEPTGGRPRADRKSHARSRLTNGKDLLPNIDGRSLSWRLEREREGAEAAGRLIPTAAITK
jgi:hypothetical protein